MKLLLDESVLDESFHWMKVSKLDESVLDESVIG